MPRGFAHGFLVLSKEAIFAYKVDNYYDKQSDRGIAFGDATLDIDWGHRNMKIKLSEKDKGLPSFSKADFFEFSEKNYE